MKKQAPKSAFLDGKSTFLHIFLKMRNAQIGKNEQTSGQLASVMPQQPTVKTS
ncbi:MAG: hypothetical protein IKH86_11990 [Prevotella sp.]|nr:hypothetical protein [Prevotella sp.]